jgi:hypothetical protein
VQAFFQAAADLIRPTPAQGFSPFSQKQNNQNPHTDLTDVTDKDRSNQRLS